MGRHGLERPKKLEDRPLLSNYAQIRVLLNRGRVRSLIVMQTRFGKIPALGWKAFWREKVLAASRQICYR